jgi:hypothetical protein
VADEIEGAVLDRIGTLAREEELLDRVVAATNQRLHRQRPGLIRRRRGHQRDLKAVKAETDRLLLSWSSSKRPRRKPRPTPSWASLPSDAASWSLPWRKGTTRSEPWKKRRVDAETVRAALGQIGAIHAHLKPFEQQELVRLVLQRAEVREHKVVLEIRTGACTQLAHAPNATDLDGKRFRYQSGSPSRTRTCNLAVNKDYPYPEKSEKDASI